MAYDQSIIDAIYARAQAVTDPSKRNRYVRAALQTGIVESGLRNLNYGDADSLGWRQERQQFYKDPTNVKNSVDRFFTEAAQLDRGQHSWELAADVQRPAAQYRGRYKDVAREAASILRGMGGAAPGSSAPAGTPGTPQVGAPSITDPGKAGDFTSLLGSLLSKPQQAPAQMAIAPPQFASQQALPQGFRPLTPNAQPQGQAQDTLSTTLGLLETLRGQGPTVTSPEVVGAAAEPRSSSIVQTVQNQRNGKLSLPKNGENNWGVVDQAGRSGKYLQQTYGIKEIGGYRANDPYPDHPSRKALDLMVYDDRGKGDAIAADLVRNYKQHGVKYIIWNQRIWHPGQGWRKMDDRGSPTQNHKDHVHVLYR